MSLLGEEGLELAELNHARAPRSPPRLTEIPGITWSMTPLQRIHAAPAGGRPPGGPCPGRSRRARRGLARPALSGRRGAGNGLLVAATETVTDEDIDALEAALREILQ